MAAILQKDALCRPQDIKDLVDPDMSVDFDVLIVNLINAFSVLAQSSQWCNRGFEKKKYIEYFSGGSTFIQVLSPPIVIDSELVVWEDASRLFPDTSKLTIYDDFDVEENATVACSQGAVNRISGGTRLVFPTGAHTVKIQYNGGIVLNNIDTNVFDVPDDLRQACAMQVSYWFKHRLDLGISSMNFGGGSISVFTPTKILPSVKTTLLSYKRFQGA